MLMLYMNEWYNYNNFSVNVLKDIDNKTKLEEEWFNIYQALAYFYDVSESEIDADE